MKRANIAGSKRTGNLIGDGQAGRHPASKSHPDHLRHPQSHDPRHSHFLSAYRGPSTQRFETQTILLEFTENPLKTKPFWRKKSGTRRVNSKKKQRFYEGLYNYIGFWLLLCSWEFIFDLPSLCNQPV